MSLYTPNQEHVHNTPSKREIQVKRQRPTHKWRSTSKALWALQTKKQTNFGKAMNNVNHGFLSNLFIIITANNYSRSMYKAVYTYISDQTKQLSSWRLAVAPTANPNKQVSRISLIREWNWNSLKMAWQARTNSSSNSFKVYFTPTSNKMARTHPINITYIIQHRNEKFKSKRQRITQK